MPRDLIKMCRIRDMRVTFLKIGQRMSPRLLRHSLQSNEIRRPWKTPSISKSNSKSRRSKGSIQWAPLSTSGGKNSTIPSTIQKTPRMRRGAAIGVPVVLICRSETPAKATARAQSSSKTSRIQARTSIRNSLEILK